MGFFHCATIVVQNDTKSKLIETVLTNDKAVAKLKKLGIKTIGELMEANNLELSSNILSTIEADLSPLFSGQRIAYKPNKK